MTRNRMIVTLPEDVQMAIKLVALKNGWKTGDVVEDAVKRCFGKEVEEARQVIKENDK